MDEVSASPELPLTESEKWDEYKWNLSIAFYFKLPAENGEINTE